MRGLRALQRRPRPEQSAVRQIEDPLVALAQVEDPLVGAVGAVLGGLHGRRHDTGAGAPRLVDQAAGRKAKSGTTWR